MNIFLLLLFSNILLAQTITVSELLKKGIDYSPQIKAQTQNLNASEYQVKQARLLGNPVFTFQGGSLKAGSSRGAVTDFTLNQPLPWPGKRSARIQAQEFLLKLSELSTEEAQLEVSHRIYLVAAEVSALQELESHYNERKRRFLLIGKSLKSRPLASPKQQVDRDLIESQINLMEKGMMDLVARKDALIWELKVLTNDSFDKVIFNWTNLPSALPRDTYLTLMEQGPKGRRIKLEGKLAENKIEEARLEARPDIMVGMNYRKEDVAPVNHFYHGQISVVIPIIDYGQHNVEAAKAAERRTKATNQMEKDQLTSEIYHLYSQHEASKKAIDVFKLKNLRSIESKFADAETAFRKGYIDALTFLQIDSQVHENIDQIYLSRLSYLSTLSNLSLLSGRQPEI